MSTMTDDDREFVLWRLNDEYIRLLAEEIRYTLGQEGRPFAVAYEPGDMTSYKLVFTPLDIAPVLERAHVRRFGSDVVREDEGAAIGLGIGEPDGRYALVSLVEHGAYPFELLRGRGHAEASGAHFDPGYVGAKLGIDAEASAIAVTVLLNEIASRP